MDDDDRKEAKASGGPADGDDGRKLSLSLEDSAHLLGARIKVFGVGGGGCNAVNRMVEKSLRGVEFIAANTDCQALKNSRATVKVQLGEKLTKGLGVGADPELGRQAALEDTEKLIELLEGSDMVFITAGLGGGTGTGATPIIANLASELGALVVAVVTKPFHFEGRRRMQQAEQGLANLKECVDTVISIPNEKLLSTVEPGTTLTEAFLYADDILRQAVQGISDLITIPGEINLDFADVKSIMSGMGMALMGTGTSTGEHRSVEAAQRAISSPLLEDTTIDGAKGVLINVTGGADMTLHEVAEASSIIQKTADPEANIIFGAVIDPEMKTEIKVTVIATGFRRGDAAFTQRAQAARPLEQAFASAERRDARDEHPESDGEAAGFDPGESAYGPNFRSLQEELEIPTFLRKQMD
jgi:cell division protein FtsZ